MKEHNLKSWPTYFDRIASREVSYDYRKIDSENKFEVGDYVLMTDDGSDKTLRLRISYIIEQTVPNILTKDYCILSLKLEG